MINGIIIIFVIVGMVGIIYTIDKGRKDLLKKMLDDGDITDDVYKKYK